MMKKLIICLISLILVTTIPIVIGDTANIEANDVNDNNDIIPLGTDEYTDCIIWIIGKCNTVAGPPEWKLGFYYPFNEKDFSFSANNEPDEGLQVLVRATSPGIYLGHEDIRIQITGGKGFFFYAGHSLLAQGNFLFVRCTAQVARVTTP
jgi:hypothetical protein